MSTLAVEWMQSPPVRLALRDLGYPTNDKLLDFFEAVLRNTDRIGDAIRRMTDPENEACRTKMSASGFRGVSQTKRKKNPWQAAIYIDGRLIRLGSFPTVDLAIDARLAAEAEHGWQPPAIRSKEAMSA